MFIFNGKTKLFKKLLWAVLLTVSLVSGLSCFRRYTLTDSEITNYYKAKLYQPRYHTYVTHNRTMHYAEVGNDTLPLLLLIHGAPGAWFGYIQLMDDTALQHKYHIISVDRAGYGKSEYGKEVTSISEQAALLQPIIDSQITKKPIIVLGRSFGAPIAAKLVLNNQSRVKKLILIGPAIDPSKEKFQGAASFARSWFIRWIIPKSILVAAKEKRDHVKELKKLLPEWQSLKVPTTIMQGADDWIVDTANTYFAKKMIVNAPTKILLIPKTGHLVSSERPALVKKEIFNN